MILRFFSGSVTPSSAGRNIAPRRRGPAGCCNGRGTGSPPARLRPRASSRFDKDASQLIADRPRAAAPPRPRNPPRPTGRRSPARCRPARGCARSRRRGRRACSSRAAMPAISMDEIAQHLAPSRRVHDFGMELHAVEPARFVGDGGERRILADVATTSKPGGIAVDAVAVAHPDRLAPPSRQTPSNSAQLSMISMSARPNSRACPPSTRPPSCSHIVFWP